jgi:hypothetical protein
VSIVFAPIWPELKQYLSVEIYDKDGGHLDPRIRIMFREVPVELALRACSVVMACVTCERPMFPIRKQEGSPWESLYYAATCPIGQRMGCARSKPARAEYERFKELWAKHPKPADNQLRLFY